MRMLIFATCVFFTTIGVSGAVEPLAFKGLALGTATLSDIQARYPRADCSSIPTRGCLLSSPDLERAKETIGGAPITMMMFFVNDGVVDTITMRIPAYGLDDVVEALKNRYGSPASDRRPERGARSVIWRHPAGQIRVDLSSGVDTASVAYQSHTAIERRKREHDAHRQKARSDL